MLVLLHLRRERVNFFLDDVYEEVAQNHHRHRELHPLVGVQSLRALVPPPL